MSIQSLQMKKKKVTVKNSEISLSMYLRKCDAMTLSEVISVSKHTVEVMTEEENTFGLREHDFRCLEELGQVIKFEKGQMICCQGIKVLFYFILFYFILFYFILFYFILFYFILFYFVLFYFMLFLM